MIKRWRHSSVFWTLVAITGFLSLLIIPRLVYAGGGAGGGGSGGGGSGGAQSVYGWGWARYDLSTTGGNKGPTHGFRNGTSWSTVRNTCAQDGYVDIFIINWQPPPGGPGGAEGYDYHSVYSGPPEFVGHFTPGQSVDNGRATAISTTTAHNNYLTLPANIRNNFTWGSDVAWFCWSNSNTRPPVAGCTATPATQNMPTGGSATINLHGTLPNGGTWPNTYYIRRFPTSFAGYHDITSAGPNGLGRNGTNVVTPPYSVTFTYFIASTDGQQTKSGDPGGQVLGSGTCDATVNVVSAGSVSAACTPGGTIPSPPSPGVAFSSTYTITVSNTTGAIAAGYRLVAAPDGAGITGATVTNSLSIPTGTHTQSITITITANYAGSYTVTLFNPANAVVPQTPCNQPITPQVAPYFQVWQNDAAAGGGFKIGDTCPSAYSAYVSPKTAGGANAQYYGGIRANSSAYKSKTDFGAVALGLIPAPSGEGFFARNNAYFANPAGSLGYFNHTSASPNHCATDFYGTTMINTPANTPHTGDLKTAISSCTADSNNERRCQYIWNGGDISGASVTIPAGVQITVYVPSDINISTNITYAEPFDPTVTADIPYFALIVKGSITLTNSATRLDGLYVAQPNVSGSTATGGDFKTCDSQCPDQLVVNGAVIAQHVELLRAHGSSQTLGGAAVTNIGNAPAEIFNFVPSMVLGAPAFSPQCPTCAEGLYSLPPVF